MSHPFRDSICGACGRPHEPPPVCRRCGDRLDAPLFGRPSCALCLARAAPGLAARAIRASAGFVVRSVSLLAALWMAAAIGASVALCSGGRVPRKTADSLTLPALYAEEGLAEVKMQAKLATPPQPPPAPSFERWSPPEPMGDTCPRYFSELAIPRVLAALGDDTRDPHALLSRASRLAAAGFDISILRAELAPGVVERVFTSASRPSSIVPVRFKGSVEGVCLDGLGGLPPGAGLARGDIITSINGVPIARPELALEAYASATRAGLVVMEILRGERRVVLAVRLPNVRPGAGAGAGSGSASAAAP